MNFTITSTSSTLTNYFPFSSRIYLVYNDINFDI